MRENSVWVYQLANLSVHLFGVLAETNKKTSTRKPKVLVELTINLV
jgi:hypothetical protein